MRKLFGSRFRTAALVAVVAAAISIPALAIGSSSSPGGVHAAKKKKSKRGPRGPRGPKGAQGPAGKDGVNGGTGPRGPSDVYEVSEPNGDFSLAGVQLQLPAGNWVIDGSAEAQNFNAATAPTTPPAPAADGTAECDLFSNQDTADSTGHLATVPRSGFTVNDTTNGQPTFKGGATTITPEGTFRLPSGGSVLLACFDYDSTGNGDMGTQTGGSDTTDMLYTSFNLRAVQAETAHPPAPFAKRPVRLAGCRGTTRTALARCAGVHLGPNRPRPPIP
jgi:hypothetical protein